MPWIDFNKFWLFPIKWFISIYNQVLFAKQIQCEVHLCNIRLLIFFVIPPEICYSRICQHIIECTSRTLLHIIVPFTFHIWKTHKLQSSTEELFSKRHQHIRLLVQAGKWTACNEFKQFVLFCRMYIVNARSCLTVHQLVLQCRRFIETFLISVHFWSSFAFFLIF